MNLSRLAIACATLAVASLAQADEARYTQCMDTASSTAAMGACIKTETTAQDERLNRVYKQLMSKLSADRQKQLKAVQRSWIVYRDKNCAFYLQPDGGTLAPVESALCVMNLTRERASELQRILSPGQ